jgi:hypothetical protein
LTHACPLCRAPIDKGQPVFWSVAINAEMREFSIDLCKLDAALCDVFPTMKNAVISSTVVMDMLRRVYE